MAHRLFEPRACAPQLLEPPDLCPLGSSNLLTRTGTQKQLEVHVAGKQPNKVPVGGLYSESAGIAEVMVHQYPHSWIPEAKASLSQQQDEGGEVGRAEHCDVFVTIATQYVD